jgi:hypothetical protein
MVVAITFCIVSIMSPSGLILYPFIYIIYPLCYILSTNNIKGVADYV